MLRPFPDFATYPTHHCVTGSKKHVYDYHGFPISEDLLPRDADAADRQLRRQGNPEGAP